MTKTPIDSNVSTSVTAKLTANPLENSSAIGGDRKDEEKPIPYVYSLSVNSINNAITGTTYSDFNAAKAAFGNRPAAIAHILEGTTIIDSFLAFERNGVVYYLKNESHSNRMSEYEDNINILKTAYGPNWESYCSLHEENNYSYYSYFTCNVDGLRAEVDTDGMVEVRVNGNWECYVIDNYNSGCRTL